MTRRSFDFYPTPMSIASLVVEHAQYNWPAQADVIWEPCCGDSRFSMLLQKAGFATIATDIQRGKDFFDTHSVPARSIVTNPPFSKIRPFIDHAFAIGVQRMALVCPERLWACGKGREQWNRHRPSSFINMDWREDYLGKGGSPDRALAVSIWDRPHSDRCEFDVWSKPA